jgi:hypothetical protein
MLLASLERTLCAQPAARPKSEKIDFTPTYLIDLVVSQDRLRDSDPNRHRSDYIHVSSLVEFCARRHVLSVKDQILNLKLPRSPDRVVWAMGKAAEHHVRRQIIERLNYRDIVGNWSCPCKELLYAGFHVPHRTCIRCGSAATNYNEFDLYDDDAKIVGHPDLILYVERKLMLVEIKSMNKTDFVKLEKPVADHVFQVGCYHRMLVQRGKVPVLPTSALLYVCKDFQWGKSPYKEFHEDMTSDYWRHIIQIAWDKAYQVKAALKKGTMPPRLTACTSANTTTAKACIACTNCFSRRS